MKTIKAVLNLIFTMILCSFSADASMLPDEDGKIEINGSKKPMLAHIMNVVKFEPENLFKNTHVITYAQDEFSLIGKVTNFPREYIDVIGKNKYTYIPFYTLEKVNEIYEKFGAILVGHKDIDLGNKLGATIVINLLNN